MERGYSPKFNGAEVWRPDAVVAETHNLEMFERLQHELQTVEVAWSEELNTYFVRSKTEKNLAYKYFTDVEMHGMPPSEDGKLLYAAFSPEQYVVERHDDAAVSEEMRARTIHLGLIEAAVRVVQTADWYRRPQQFAAASQDLLVLFNCSNQPVHSYKSLVIRPGRGFAPDYARVYRKFQRNVPQGIIDEVMAAMPAIIVDPPSVVKNHAAAFKLEAHEPAATSEEANLPELPNTKTGAFLRLFKHQAEDVESALLEVTAAIEHGDIAEVALGMTKENRLERSQLGVIAYFDFIHEKTGHKAAGSVLNRLEDPHTPVVRVIELANAFTELSNRQKNDRASRTAPLALQLSSMPDAFNRLRAVMRHLGLEQDEHSQQLGLIVSELLLQVWNTK